MCIQPSKDIKFNISIANVKGKKDFKWYNLEAIS